MMHIDTTLAAAKPIDRDELKSVERWILSRLNETTRTVNRALSGFRYDEASNGNKSDIHWDMVMRQDPEVGGGEIWFDDQLIRKNGTFLAPTLLGLNPENLK